MTLVDAAWRWGEEIRSAGTRLVALAEAEAAEPAAVARVLDAIEQAARALRANLPQEPAPALAPDAPPLLWDLDPDEHPPDGHTGPYPALRWEIVACAGRAIMVALIDRGGTPRVVRAPVRPGRALTWTRRITEDVRGREDDAFAEMLGYARAALEQQVAADATRARTHLEGVACDLPAEPAPAPECATQPEGDGATCGRLVGARERLDMAHLRDGRGTPNKRGVLLCSADGRAWAPSTAADSFV